MDARPPGEFCEQWGGDTAIAGEVPSLKRAPSRGPGTLMAHHRPTADMHLACGPLSRVRRAHSREERSVRGAELGIVGSRLVLHGLGNGRTAG